MTPRYMQAFFNGRMPSLPSLAEMATINSEAQAHLRGEWRPSASKPEEHRNRATVVNLRRRLAVV